jgi:hypothetical protein
MKRAGSLESIGKIKYEYEILIENVKEKDTTLKT